MKYIIFGIVCVFAVGSTFSFLIEKQENKVLTSDLRVETALNKACSAQLMWVESKLK